MLLSVAGLVAVALVWVLIARPWDPGRPAGDQGSPPDAVGAELVRWTDAELEPDARVVVPDDVLAGVLSADGRSDRFRAAGSGDSDGGGDGLRVLRGEPPAGSLVLTRIPEPGTSGLVLVDLRPGRPTAEELERRQRLAQAVLANPGTGATGPTADVLERGHVDPRLLGLLAALVTQFDVRIADLPPAGAQPGGDGPLVRTALVDRAAGSAVPGDPVATDRLLAFLDAQRPPYAPHVVEVTDAGVRIAFRYASDPDALVSENAP